MVSTFKKLEPFIAIGILIMLITVAVLLYQDSQLKKEISKNCGWGDEDYLCYCEHSDINAIQNKLYGGGINFSDVKLDK